MSNIKIALTNLGKYNEGELTYAWLELPATPDEVKAAMDEIGIGGEYEEYFISDYEAPFEIGEYESLANLNEVAEQLEEVNGWDEITSGNYDAGDVINFASDLENNRIVDCATKYTQDIVSTDYIDELIDVEMQSGWGWIRIKHFLGGIEWLLDEYYILNGYGNVENLSTDGLKNIVSDLFNEII